MNIAVDIEPLAGSSTSSFRGIGIYTLNLLMEMFKVDKQNTYFLFNCYGESVLNTETLPPNVHYSSFYSGKDNYLLSGRTLWTNGHSNIFKGLFKAFIKKNKIDTFLITSPFDELICFCKDWFEDVNLAVIVYDLIPYIFKKQYLSDKNHEAWYMYVIDFIKSADTFLAISESVKSDLIKYLGIDEHKITTIHSGVGNEFKQVELSEQSKKDILKKYEITGKFIIFPGGGDYRKNVKNSVLAYLQLPKYIKDEYQFVITGITSDDYRLELNQICASEGCENRVLINGHIPLDDLIDLYNLAELLVFTSIYEGFGLPVVESWKCGLNVLTSNNSSLGEVGEGAAVLIDPFSIYEVTNGMIQALTKTDYSAFNNEIKKKLEKYTWNNSAIKALGALNAQPEKKVDLAGNKKKIAFFTPLNPLKSGISDYSEDLIDELCNYCDIDVYIDEGYEPTKIFSKNVSVMVHAVFTSNRNIYDEIIYQMGNSTFHTYMIPYIQQFPGIVVIHDYNMHQLIYHCYFNKGSLYKEYLKREVSDIDEYMYNMPMDFITSIDVNRFVTDYAKKIIVHNEYSRRALFKKEIGYVVKKINSFVRVVPLEDPNKLRNKYGIDENVFIFASFGQAAGVKRIIPILKAFAEACKKHDNIRYYIVGNILQEIENELKQLIAEYKIQEKVIITGYTDIESFWDYIQMADVCFNLRYPYLGETSASLMRILLAAKTAVVTNIGAFSEVPDDCCIKISYENEEQEIQNCIQKIMNYPELLKFYGKNAREFAEKNLDIKKIVLEHYDFIFSKEISYINNNDLKKIIINEVSTRNLNEEDIYKLSDTLAYIVTE